MNEKDIANVLDNINFYEKYEGKEDMLDNLLEKLRDKNNSNEINTVRSRLTRPAFGAAAAVICVLLAATSIFAANYINKITIGKMSVSSVENIEILQLALENGFQGQVRSFITISDNENAMNAISEKEKGTKVKIKPLDENIACASLEDANQYLDFELKAPRYIPEGYRLDKIALVKQASGEINQLARLMYTSREFVDDESFISEPGDFSIFVHYIGDNGNSYVETIEHIEKIDINGTEAVIIGKETIMIELNGCIYYFSFLDRDELIKIAASLL